MTLLLDASRGTERRIEWSAMGRSGVVGCGVASSILDTTESAGTIIGTICIVLTMVDEALVV